MRKRGRPPGKIFPYSVFVSLNDELKKWIEKKKGLKSTSTFIREKLYETMEIEKQRLQNKREF